MNEVKIIKIEPINGGAIKKGMTNTGRMGFYVEVNYTLADGRTLKSVVSSERKKNLPQALARAQSSADAGCFLASFSKDGDYFGTVQKFHIGPRGIEYAEAANY